MSFRLQLKLLVWKNYTLRKRQWVRICLVIKIWGLRISFQGRLIVEIVWPLILFIILFLVRLRGLKKYHHECKLLSVIWNFVSPINFVLFRSLWGEGDAFSRVPSFCSKFHLYFQQHLPQRHMDPAWQASGVQQFIVSIVSYTKSVNVIFLQPESNCWRCWKCIHQQFWHGRESFISGASILRLHPTQKYVHKISIWSSNSLKKWYDSLFFIIALMEPSIIISFSVPDFNLRSLVLDQESFLVDLQDFLQSKNISVDSSNLQTLTQLNFQLASITRGMLSY